MDKDVIKIANCSGYYGDKLSAAKEMVEGGPIDVLTGDYLAELTMTILYSQKISRGEDKGYVGTFLKQIKEVAEDCKTKNIKIVTNAGGLNPKSMATEIEKILKDMSIDLKVAYIEGDDLIPRIDELSQQGENFINIDKIFSVSEPIPVSDNPYTFPRRDFVLPETFFFDGEQRLLSEELEHYKTDGLIVLHNGNLLYENYWNNNWSKEK